MPMTDYVGKHGIDDFDLGMEVQKELTKRGTSESGIRPFINRDQERALALLSQWASDPNYHVRRLVSEGSRPRLPWAMRLPALIADPNPLFPILHQLKDDAQEYVRRSVANNLNDIAKDHPDKVAKIAEKWLKNATPDRARLVRHACRTLVKQGHKPTLVVLGFKKPAVSLTQLNLLTPIVRFGEALSIEVCLASESAAKQDLVLDYVIHHRLANGKTSPKVFKWKTFTLEAGESWKSERKHRIKPITTRTYYAGSHGIEIQINGERLGFSNFELVMPET